MSKKATPLDHIRKAMPESRADLEIDATIEADAYKLIEQGFVPKNKHDKWYIYMNEAGWLHIHRSASGSCIFRIKFEPTSSGYTISHAQVNRDPAQYRGTDPVYDSRLLVYLLRKLLLKHDIPFPMPSNVPHQSKNKHEESVMGSKDKSAPSFYIPLNILN